MAKQDIVKDLRDALTPASGVIPKLTLNKHFSRYPNLSLFDAKNIKLSNDIAVLQNEEGLLIDRTVEDFFSRYFTFYKIVGCINTPEELILFVNVNGINPKNKKVVIVRYNPKNNIIGIVYGSWYKGNYYNGLSYNGGKIEGTYTYNVDNALIIVWCEHDCEDNINKPMMTINLGKFDSYDGHLDETTGIWIDESNIFNDRQLEECKLSIVPEVNLPRFTNVDYVSGNAYNAWYYVYIRYKINNIDYTQWYNVGYPIYVLNVNKLKVVDLEKHRLDTSGIDGSDSIGKTFAITLDNIDTRYSKYQLGFIVLNKTLNKNFITSDIDISINGNLNSYKFDTNTLIEEEIDTTKYFNYFDVKNIINYKNKLYISNYKETPVKKIDTSKIRASLGTFTNIYSDFQFDVIKDTNVVIKNWSNTILWLYNIIDYRKITQQLTIECFPNYRYYSVAGAYLKQDTLRSFTCDINNLTITRNYHQRFAKWLDIGAASIRETNCITYFKKFTATNNDKTINNLYKLRDIVEDENFGTTINIAGFDVDALTYIFKLREMGFDPNGNDPVTFQCFDNTDEPGFFRIKNSRGEVIFLSFIDDNPLTDYSLLDESCLNETFDADTQLQKRNGDLILEYWTKNYLHTDSAHVTDSSYFPFSNGHTYAVKASGHWIFNPQGDGSIPIYSKDSIDQSIIRNEDYLTNNSYCNTTLIPGGIYDFYIHFVDKYGIPTNGYKLEELMTIHLNHVPDYCILDAAPLLVDGNICYFAYIEQGNKNVLKFTEDGASLNSLGTFARFYGYDNYGLRFVPVREDMLSKPGVAQLKGQMKFNVENHLKNLVPNIADLNYSNEYNKNQNLKFYQVANNYSGLFIETLYKGYNDFGEVVWKVPLNSVTKDKFYKITFKNIEQVLAANGYDSFFISYKKYEDNQQIIGIGNENNIASELINIEKVDYNCDFLLKIRNPLTNIDIHSQPIEYDSVFVDFDRNFYEGLNAINRVDLFNITRHRLGFAGEYSTNRLNKHSLYLTNNEIELNLNNTQYLILGITFNNEAYHNKDEYLFRAGNIGHSSNASNFTINSGFNGVTGDMFSLLFNQRGVLYQHGIPVYIVEDVDFEEYDKTTYEFVSYLAANIKFNSEKLFNSKYLKNPFTLQIAYRDEEDGISVHPIKINTIANAQDTLDLFDFKLPTINELNPNVYLQYNDDKLYKYEFDNTIRYSNVISDESRNNNWRKFNTNDYKIIAENKGKIVSLRNIGDWIFIHNEHALFSIQFKDSLDVKDESLQIKQSSITDVTYKEMIPSNNGFGGLQDKYASILGDFGYIFYENDTKRFYRIDAGQFAFIDEDIKDYISTLNVQTVRFGWDKFNNRVLITITYKERKYNVTIIKTVTLSYNYGIGTFISFHDYEIEDSYTLKDKLYLINLENNKSYIRKFIQNENYNIVEKYVGDDIIALENDSSISIIFNQSYFSEKYLEYIDYKIKLFDDVKDLLYYNKDYAGNIIKIYNDDVDTGDLDIFVDKNKINDVELYFKPRRNLGYWSLNNLRDIQNSQSSNPTADVMSRLYGNFFISKFIFNSKDIINKLLLFENIRFNVSNDKN